MLNEKLQVSDTSIFDKILELAQGFDKYDMDVDSIFFDNEGNFLGDETNKRMKKRLAIASVLLAKPDILLLDEPLAALDKPVALSVS